MIQFTFGKRYSTKKRSRLSHNLQASVRDGMAYAATIGSAENYFSAFAIFLKASTLQIGLLSALPPLFAAINQVFSLHLLQVVRSRRWLIVMGARLQSFTLLPILLLPFIFGPGTDTGVLLIICVLLYHGSLGVTVPLWSSLIGELVPTALRGRFFGFRNQMAGLCTFLAMILAGAVLQLFSHFQLTAWGYALIFLLAALSRLYSARWLSRYDDPEYHSPPEAYFSFLQFVRRTPYSNFARFVFFVALIQCGAAFSAPYFAVYMLRDLKFPYIEYSIIAAAPALAQIAVLRHWGRLIDRYGSKRVLTLCSYGVSLNPLLWALSSNVFVIILIQLYSGIVWAGFNLASSTFLLDAVTPAKRARCAAYQALVQSAMMLAGSLSGAFVVKFLPATFDFLLFTWTPVSPFIALFVLSGLFRFLISGYFLSRFQEVRKVDDAVPRALGLQMINLQGFTDTALDLLIGPFSSEKRRRKN